MPFSRPLTFYVRFPFHQTSFHPLLFERCSYYTCLASFQLTPTPSPAHSKLANLNRRHQLRPPSASTDRPTDSVCILLAPRPPPLLTRGVPTCRLDTYPYRSVHLLFFCCGTTTSRCDHDVRIETVGRTTLRKDKENNRRLRFAAIRRRKIGPAEQ